MLIELKDLSKNDKILIHTCCGPCLSSIFPLIKERGAEVYLYYYNPNIHPYSEFISRYQSLLAFLSFEGICSEVIIGNYDLKDFFRIINGTEEYPERCRFCYRLRLHETAKKASELGVRIFTTTILASPYQHHEVALEEALRAAETFDLHVLNINLKKEDYMSAIRNYKKNGLYYQNYCGCVFSNYEALKQRGIQIG